MKLLVDLVELDYVMSILTVGGGSGVQGQLVIISGKISGTGTIVLQLQITLF